MKKVLLSLLLIIVPVTSFAITQIVSVNSDGNPYGGWADVTHITPDGRYVVFFSDSNNIVSGDVNYYQDVFVRDLLSGTTEIISIDSNENFSDGGSQPLAITPDGRYVLFSSNASNLVANDTNWQWDLFVRDRLLGTTEIISVDNDEVIGDSATQYGVITPDGRYVYFSSYSSNLVSGDTNGNYDAFVRDRQLGTTTIVGTDELGTLPNGNTNASFISDNGRYIVFSSYADNIISGDTNNDLDVFYKDLVNNTVTLVSASSSGVQANGFSDVNMMTPDGRYVLFRSSADNLVSGDTNGQFEPFVKDMQTNQIYRVAINNIGDEATDLSQPVHMTPDGRYVLFYSNANNLHPSDYNWTTDTFVRDVFSGTTTLVSIEPNGYSANSSSYPMMISDNGRYVYFYSDASNLVDGDNNWNSDVFVRDIVTNTTTLVSRDSMGNNSNGYSRVNPYPTISMTPDGRYVIFGSDANNLDPIDFTRGSYDVFINEWQVVLGAAPTILEPIDGSYRNTTGDIVVEGVGLSGADIRVTFLGNQFLTTVDSNNEWNIVLPWQLDGAYTVYAQQKEQGSSVWSMTGYIGFTIDTIKPSQPTIVTPIENTLISGGSMYVVGQGEVGGTIVVRVGKQVKEGNIDGLGNWTVGPYTIVPGYKYGIIAKQRDMANNESDRTLPRTIYGVQMGVTGVNLNNYLPDLILYKKGVTSANSETTVNPNEDVTYTLDYLNGGKGYSTGVMIVEDVPENTCFTVGSISGLNNDYIVEYSNTDGVNYGYTPLGSTGAQDCAITHFRVRMLVPYEAKNNVVNDTFLGQMNGIQVTADGLVVSSVPNMVTLTGTPGEQIITTYGDFNNDSYPDAITISYRWPSYNVTDYVIRGTGSQYPTYEALESSSSYPSSESHGLATGDFNNDGYDDVIIINGDVYYSSNADDWIYYGSSTGLRKSILTGSAGNGEKVAVGDFNNDGYDDALLLNGSYWGDRGNSKVVYGGATGTTIQTVTNLRGYIIASYVTDFNSDGYDDALIGRVAGQDEIIAYGGATGFTLSFLGGTAGNTWGFSQEDFNQDGYKDILFMNEFNPVKVMYGLSTGGYAMPTNSPISYFYREQPQSIDFNTDGLKDYVILGSTIDIIISQSGVAYENIAPVHLLDPLGQPIPNTYRTWASSDINGDGLNDTVFVNRANEATALPVLVYYGGSTTATYLPYNVYTFFISTTDFNKDGLGDILIDSVAGFGRPDASILYGVSGHSGDYQTILHSTGNISGWDKLLIQDDIISGDNKIEYSVYGTLSGNICNTGSILVGPQPSYNNEIDISSISGENSSICVKAEFSIMSGTVSPVLRSIIGLWNNEDKESFTFDVKVKGGHYSGTAVTNIAYIGGSSVDSNTGNNTDMHILTGLPNFIAGGGGYGGGEGKGGGGGDGKGDIKGEKEKNDKKEEKKVEKVETPQEKAEKIKEIDMKKPEKPVVEIPKKEEIKDAPKSVEITPTTPNIAIKEAIVQTSYVREGSSVDVKTVENPVLKSEKRCYSPKEVVEITLGKEKTNKDLLVYQALLKSYDLTIFSDTDSYKPQNGLKRYEAAKMFTNFAKHILCREKTNEYKSNYVDIEGIDETLKPYIIEAYEYGILRGSNDRFRPLDRISRKEFVAALMRMFVNQNLDVYNAGNEWDKEYVELFEYYGLESIVGEEEEIDRYEMSKIMYKLYYNTSYEWTEKGYVLPVKKK